MYQQDFRQADNRPVHSERRSDFHPELDRIISCPGRITKIDIINIASCKRIVPVTVIFRRIIRPKAGERFLQNICHTKIPVFIFALDGFTPCKQWRFVYWQTIRTQKQISKLTGDTRIFMCATGSC